jgi:hypothetical protein
MDWLDSAVLKAKQKYQSQRAQEERVAQEEALKLKLGNQFCRELFTWFESVEVTFNSRFGGQVLSVHVVGNEGGRCVQVLARPIRAQERIAELSYQESTKTLGLSIGSGTNALIGQVIKLVFAADGTMCAEIGANHYTPERLGQKVIEDLLA